MPPPVFRFAPSPNGYLHLGHAYSALLNSDLARRAGGRLLLRIEDIDAARCKPEYEAAIDEDLHWLGLTWETPVRRQSEHIASYRAALDRLNALGLIYPSFESRAEIARMVVEREAMAFSSDAGAGSREENASTQEAGAPFRLYRNGNGSRAPWPRDPDGAPLYPGAANRLSADERAALLASGAPYALRLDMAAAVARAGTLDWCEDGAGPGGETGSVTARPEMWGDVVLARKDTPASYHLAVVVDDAAQGVTHIVRGQDLFWATSVHRLLQHLLDLPAPRYRHHALLRDADGAKLSKSTRATGLRELRAAGVAPAEVRRRVGFD